MLAVTLQQPRQLHIGPVPDPPVAHDEVLLRVKATGICGTDLLVYQGKYASPFPLVLGHEFAGVVEQVGAGVKGLQRDDRVTAEASWGCGICPPCKQGETDLCAARISLGRTRNGSFAEYLSVPARVIHVLPPEVSFEQGQAIATVASAVRAVRRGRPGFGERVAVLGPGMAGLILLQLAVLNGAMQVVVFGTRDWRLKLAQSLGATEVVNVRHEGWMEQARELTAGRGFDLVFEAAGNPKALDQALQVVRNGGRVVAFSVLEGPMDQFPAHLLYSKEVTVLGSRGASGGYQLAIDLLHRGLLRLEPLVSHRLPLNEAEKGFALTERREEGVLRVVFTPS